MNVVSHISIIISTVGMILLIIDIYKQYRDMNFGTSKLTISCLVLQLVSLSLTAFNIGG